MVDPNAKDADIEIPVLIVGAGPAGLTLALALARHGVAALTVEKHPSTAHTPRAHIINQRTGGAGRPAPPSTSFPAPSRWPTARRRCSNRCCWPPPAKPAPTSSFKPS